MRKNNSEYFNPEGTEPISTSKLRKSKRSYQIEVMKDWFSRHFENPAESTPYESAEGGYIYIWGGPFDAREELESEFSGIVSDKAINALVDELESECYEWSGIPSADEYDDYFYDVISSNTAAHENLIKAQEDTSQLLEQQMEGPVQHLLLRLLFVNAIGALETFLSDVFINEVLGNRDLIKKFVSTNPEFKERKFCLSEIFDRYEMIDKDVRTYLMDLIWHNLPKVKEMYKSVFEISFPDTMKPLYSAINKRHDIVHRNGRSKDGTEVTVTKEEIQEVLHAVRELADHIDGYFKMDEEF